MIRTVTAEILRLSKEKIFVFIRVHSWLKFLLESSPFVSRAFFRQPHLLETHEHRHPVLDRHLDLALDQGLEIIGEFLSRENYPPASSHHRGGFFSGCG